MLRASVSTSLLLLALTGSASASICRRPEPHFARRSDWSAGVTPDCAMVLYVPEDRASALDLRIVDEATDAELEVEIAGPVDAVGSHIVAQTEPDCRVVEHHELVIYRSYTLTAVGGWPVPANIEVRDGDAMLARFNTTTASDGGQCWAEPIDEIDTTCGPSRPDPFGCDGSDSGSSGASGGSGSADPDQTGSASSGGEATGSASSDDVEPSVVVRRGCSLGLGSRAGSNSAGLWLLIGLLVLLRRACRCALAQPPRRHASYTSQRTPPSAGAARDGRGVRFELRKAVLGHAADRVDETPLVRRREARAVKGQARRLDEASPSKPRDQRDRVRVAEALDDGLHPRHLCR